MYLPFYYDCLVGRGMLLFTLAALVSSELCAAVSLPNVFSDNMVLQQDTEVNVWGTADSGETVSVSGSWSNTIVSTVAEADGSWLLKLPTPPANTDGTTYTLSVVGDNQIDLTNVAIGDVWFIAGQSNVNIAMSFNIEGGAEALAAADDPQIRLLRVRDRATATPQDEYFENSSFREWKVCHPTTAGPFSAVGYFFARDLYEYTQVPLGMIHCAKAGTAVQAWTPREDLEELEAYATHAPWEPTGNADTDRLVPSIYYNGSLAPFKNFTIRGILWYQGETNVDLDEPDLYALALPKLIAGLRRVWNQGDFPFYLVNIVPYPDYPNDSYPEVVEGQGTALALPNTALVTTLDLANPSLHPPQKREVGERLSRIVRVRQYGEEMVETGPLYDGKYVRENRLHVRFRNAENGLTLMGGGAGFELAGADGIYYPAMATVEGSEVVLESAEVENPLNVRYAWNTYPQASLFNAEGLAAPLFRSQIPDYLSNIQGFVPRDWGAYEVVGEGWVNDPVFEWLWVNESPWIYNLAMDHWLYLPEPLNTGPRGWLYLVR
jgi:sialate O-acetylesterase